MGNAESRERFLLRPLVKQQDNDRKTSSSRAIAVPGKKTEGAIFERVFFQGEQLGLGSPSRTLEFPSSRRFDDIELCLPSLDSQSQLEVLEACRKELSKNRVYLMQDTPDFLKEFLECPLLPMPPAVRAAYYLHSPPPLEHLCPLDFPMVDWASFDQEVAAWFGTLDDDARSPADMYNFESFRHQIYELVCMLGQTPPGRPSTIYTFFGEPDGMWCRMDGKPSLVIVMGIVELEKLDYLVARLFGYMLASGASFGIASTFDETVFVKKLPCEEGLIVSTPVNYKDGVMKRISFMIQQASKEKDSSDVNFMIRNVIPRPVPAAFDWEPIHARMAKLGGGIPLLDVDRLISGCSNDFSLVRELENLEKDYPPSANLLYTAKYMGKSVFLKVMDLTCHYHRNLDDSLVKAMREVHAYNWMKSLQGKVIPNLVSYGFLRGAMFFYLMMSCGGMDGVARRNLRKFAATIPRSLEALRQVYSTGICTHGNLPSVLYSYNPGAKEFSIKLVGFSESEVEVDATKRKVHLERDIMALEMQLLRQMGVSNHHELSCALREHADRKERDREKAAAHAEGRS